MQEVIVTTAPMYNIILQKLNTADPVRDIYTFKDETTSDSKGKTTYYPNATEYTDSKVNGYEQIYGFALEVRKPGNGVAGVEFPDSSKDFTFDVDLSAYSLAQTSGTQDLIAAGFKPLLYFSAPNSAGGTAVVQIPFSNEAAASTFANKNYCYNSGNVSMVQSGTTVHVTVKDYQLDLSQFPQQSADNKTSYYEVLQKIREGVFSAYKFSIVYPYVNDEGKTIQDLYGNGTLNYSATVKNMSATSISGTTSTVETVPLEADNTDNKQSGSVELAKGGTKEHRIYYSDRDNWVSGYSPGKIWNDADMAAAGAQDVAFTVNYRQSNVGDAYPVSDCPVAIDQLVLFDRSAIGNITSEKVDRITADNITVDGKTTKRGNVNGYDCKILYAVYKDKRLTNETMRTASIDDFEFYETKPKDGFDAMLFQYRGCNNGSSINLIAQCFADVKATVESNQVYMITAVTNTWTVGDLQSKQDEVLDLVGKTDASKLTRDDWRKWMKANVSEINTINDKKLVNKVPASDTIDNRSYYEVPTYINNKYAVTKDHKFSITSADGLYIVPYTTTVVKSVAQLDENGEPIKTFNVSKEQRYVDYVVAGSIRYGNDVEIPEGATTTVYLEDTLPIGLTYEPGSAYWGGTYSSQYLDKGIVTGGMQIEPEITTNAKGQTVLRWKIENVELKDGALPQLHYSCKIGNEEDESKDVKQGQNLTSTVNIKTTEDQRDEHIDNQNISDAGININKSEEFYIVKRGKPQLEVNDNTGYYELVASNTNGTAKDNLCLIDTMPNNKDGKSVINGIYNLTSVTVNKKLLKDEDNLTLWYTNEDSYIGKTAKDIDSSEISEENGWKQASRTTVTIDGVEYYSFTGDGLVADENGKAWPSVIAYKQDSLKSNTKVVLRLNYSSIAAEKDKLQNVLTTMSGDSEINSDFTPEVYKRSLEGTVWEDKDKDGKLENGETKLGKVKVTLYQKQADGSWKPYEALKEMVKNEDGTYEERTCPSTIETDENGHYKFTGLPEGEFKVEFTSSDDENGTKLTDYKVTKDHASENDEETSKVESDNVETDADNENILKSGKITNIKMPSIEEMSVSNTKSYNLPNQNLGLTKETTSVEVNKTWNDNEDQDGLRPDEITVNLLADGQKVKSEKITADKNWKYTFTGLDKYKDGQVITYTISEDAVEGYTTSYDGYNITNTHEVATTSVKVTKAWDDHDNQDGKRPDSVVVHLYANGEKTDQTVELSNDNNWMAVFDNLDKFKDGQVIQYTVEEEKVNSYKATVTGDQDQGFVITNTYQKDSTPVVDQPHSDKPSQNNKSNSKKSHVSTGDNQEVGLFGLMGLLSLSGFTFLKKKRKED